MTLCSVPMAGVASSFGRWMTSWTHSPHATLALALLVIAGLTSRISAASVAWTSGFPTSDAVGVIHSKAVVSMGAGETFVSWDIIYVKPLPKPVVNFDTPGTTLGAGGVIDRSEGSLTTGTTWNVKIVVTYTDANNQTKTVDTGNWVSVTVS